MEVVQMQLLPSVSYTYRAEGASARRTFNLGPLPLFNVAPFRLSIARAALDALSYLT